MTEELFDVLDCSGRKTGRTIPRDEAHRTSAWHGAFHCLIIYEREGRGHALFQKRSLSKLIAPGKLDVSVGGHYAAGENAEVAGPREIREELGLSVSFGDLVPVGRRIFVYCFTPLENAANSYRDEGGKKPLSVIEREQDSLTGLTPGIMEYEFQDVFLFPKHIRPEELALQAGEVDAVFELDIERGIELFTGKLPVLECPLFTGKGLRERASISPKDFVPCLDNYYLKLLLLARRYLNGERELLVI